MSKRKKDNDIIVTSLGTSTNEVTGSCWSVSYRKNDGTRGLVVIECGLSQSEPKIEKLYNNNRRMLENISKGVVENCVLVVLGHS